MQCWERHNRYLVKEEDLAESHRLASADGLTLMVKPYAFGPGPGPISIYVMDDEQAAPDFKGDRFCHRLALVRDESEALDWFNDMKASRPWETWQQPG